MVENKNETFYKEKVDSLKNMMEMTTRYLEDVQQELETAKKELEQKNKEFMQSVAYAENIQQNLLPETSKKYCSLTEFIPFVKQRDRIGGDMIFSKGDTDHLCFGLLDCTGHGIPGALISMMGHAFLSQMDEDTTKNDPAEMLNQLDEKVRAFFQNNKNQRFMHDGMDAALCCIDFEAAKLSYATAGRPIWIRQKNDWRRIKPNKISIGGKFMGKFENQKINISKGDEIFLFSDGLADQFGGPRDKKFLTKRVLRELNNKEVESFKERLSNLDTSLNKWRGKTEQTDDISYLAIKI